MFYIFTRAPGPAGLSFTHTLALAHAQTVLLFIRTYKLGMLIATLLGTYAITPLAFLFHLLGTGADLLFGLVT